MTEFLGRQELRVLFSLFRPDANPPIPPDAKLTYEIQLLAVRDGPNISTMSDQERMTIG